MKYNSRLLVMLVTSLMAILGLSAAPANAAAKPVSLTQVMATLSGGLNVELTVKCAAGKTYQFQLFNVIQGESARWDDDPAFVPTPCGTRETLSAWTGSGPVTAGKAELRAILDLCEANDPTACTTVEIWKDVRLRS